VATVTALLCQVVKINTIVPGGPRPDVGRTGSSDATEYWPGAMNTPVAFCPTSSPPSQSVQCLCTFVLFLIQAHPGPAQMAPALAEASA